MTEILKAADRHHKSSRQTVDPPLLHWVPGADVPGSSRRLHAWETTQPLDIPSKNSGGLPSSFEAARRALDPSNSPSSGPVYHGRFSRRKNSCDNFGYCSSPGDADGAYQGHFGYERTTSESAIPGITSTGDIQGMLNPTHQYHGRFGDTTGHSPPSVTFEPELPRSSSSGRLHGNILLRPPSKPDPFGPDQEYHGPLE